MEWHGASQLLVLLLRFAATGIARVASQSSQPAASTAGRRYLWRTGLTGWLEWSGQGSGLGHARWGRALLDSE